MKHSRHIIPLVLTLCMVCLNLQTGRADERVTLATLDWEPYVGRNMTGQGYIARIVKEAYRRSGIEVEIQFHQWSRVIGLAKKGKVDGYFPEYYADSIRAYAHFSDPIPAGPLGFFTRRASPIVYTDLEGLKGYRIGTVKGYINTREFDDADFLDKHPVNDDLSNLRLLLAGRVDLVVTDKYVGFYLTRKYMPDDLARIKFLPKVLETKNIHLCISKRTPASHALLNAFNSGLRQMKADRTLDDLMPDFKAKLPN